MLLRLPRKNMSLLIYLIAFLYQVSLRPANRLTIESISVIFGPCLIGTSRLEGQASNGINSSKASSEGLRWLLENWEDSLSQDLLDEDYDCFASPFVGQTAWSTPNILGESLGDPFNTSQSPTAKDAIEPSAAAEETDHHGPVGVVDRQGHSDSLPAMAEDTSAGLPSTTSHKLDAPSDSGHGSGAQNSQITSNDMSTKVNNTANGTRSVSGFAKGEHFTDEDINADPNAAQLFGSLSQLFTTERRKVKAYQAQVEELQSQQMGLEATIASLQSTLAQSNQRGAALDNEIAHLKDQLRTLEETSTRSANAQQQQQQELDTTRRELEALKAEHANVLEQSEKDKALLAQQHARALEENSTSHARHQEEQQHLLQQQHEEDRTRALTAVTSQHQEELRRLQAEHDDEKARMVQEIHQLREAIQVSDRERDGAREHLQRIRALLDAAQS